MNAKSQNDEAAKLGAVPSPRQLEGLLAALDAVEAGESAFGGAASSLGVDVAAAMRLIRRLQKKLGVPLVQSRGGGRVDLTREAQLLRGRARDVLDSLKAFHAAADHVRAGLPIRFGAYPSHVQRFAGSAIAAFSTEERQLTADAVVMGHLADDVRIHAGQELIDSLRRGHVDVVVAPDMATSGIEREHLYRWKLVAVDTAGELGDAGEASVEQLVACQLLTSPEGHNSRQLLEDAARRASITLNFGTSSTNVPALLALHDRALGVPVVPSDSLPPGFARRTVVVTANGAPIDGAYAAYYRSDAVPDQRDRIRRFVDHLVRFAQQARPGEPDGGAVVENDAKAQAPAGSQSRPRDRRSKT